MSDSSEESASCSRGNTISERLKEIVQYKETIRSISEEAYTKCEVDVASIISCLTDTASSIGEKLDDLHALAKENSDDLARVEKKLRDSNNQLLNTRSIKAMGGIQKTIEELRVEQAALKDVKREVEELVWMHQDKRTRTERTIAIFSKDVVRLKCWYGLTHSEPEDSDKQSDSDSSQNKSTMDVTRTRTTKMDSCSGSQPSESQKKATRRTRKSTAKSTATRTQKSTRKPEMSKTGRSGAATTKAPKKKKKAKKVTIAD